MKKQRAEFIEILKVLDAVKAFNHIILIGSWALPIYEQHYNIEQIPFTTRDIDFTVPHPPSAKVTPLLSSQLAKIGYEITGNIMQETERFIFKELEVEFICPDGRFAKEGKDFNIKGLGVVAVPLKFQKHIEKNSINATFEGMNIRVPEINYWAFHKLAVSQRRSDLVKAEKDIRQVVSLKKHLNFNELERLKNLYVGKFADLYLQGYKKAFRFDVPF